MQRYAKLLTLANFSLIIFDKFRCAGAQLLIYFSSILKFMENGQKNYKESVGGADDSSSLHSRLTSQLPKLSAEMLSVGS